MADPIESFSFERVQSELPPSLLEGKGEKMGEPQGLHEEANGSFANRL